MDPRDKQQQEGEDPTKHIDDPDGWRDREGQNSPNLPREGR